MTGIIYKHLMSEMTTYRNKQIVKYIEDLVHLYKSSSNLVISLPTIIPNIDFADLIISFTLKESMHIYIEKNCFQSQLIDNLSRI